MAIVAIEHFTCNACFAVIHRILDIYIRSAKEEEAVFVSCDLSHRENEENSYIYTYLRKYRLIFIFQVVIYLLLQLRYSHTSSCRRSDEDHSRFMFFDRISTAIHI